MHGSKTWGLIDAVCKITQISPGRIQRAHMPEIQSLQLRLARFCRAGQNETESVNESIPACNEMRTHLEPSQRAAYVATNVAD